MATIVDMCSWQLIFVDSGDVERYHDKSSVLRARTSRTLPVIITIITTRTTVGAAITHQQMSRIFGMVASILWRLVVGIEVKKIGYFRKCYQIQCQIAYLC